MLTKENFTLAYAVTDVEPTEAEIRYVMENVLDTLNQRNDCDFVTKLYQCSIMCGCEDEADDEEVNVYGYYVTIPNEVAAPDFDGEDDDRLLHVIQCSRCGKWALCD